MDGNHHIATTRAVIITGPGLTLDRTKGVWLTPVVNLVPLTVDGTVGVVGSLVMEWDAILSLEHLQHLGLGAWSSR